MSPKKVRNSAVTSNIAEELDVPFIAANDSLFKPNEEVTLSAGGLHANYLFLLGGTNSNDWGSVGWRVPMGQRDERYFLGTKLGEIRLIYADGVTQVVPVVLGYNACWHQVFSIEGYRTPFDDPAGAKLLEDSLHLKVTGKKPPRAYIASSSGQGLQVIASSIPRKRHACLPVQPDSMTAATAQPARDEPRQPTPPGCPPRPFPPGASRLS